MTTIKARLEAKRLGIPATEKVHSSTLESITSNTITSINSSTIAAINIAEDFDAGDFEYLADDYVEDTRVVQEQEADIVKKAYDKNPERAALQVNIDDVRLALEYDAEFLIQFLIGENIDLPVPEFHKNILVDMTDNDNSKIVLAIPRGCSKTTLAKIAAFKLLQFSSYSFVIYLGASAEMSRPACQDIIEFFESDNYTRVFGAIRWVKRQVGIGKYEFYVGTKLCILQAIGPKQRFRGKNVHHMRPEVAVVDDFEFSEVPETSEKIQEKRRWFYGTFMKALSGRKQKVIMLGNFTVTDTILAAALQDPDWTSYHYGILLQNGESLWPDMWPIKALQADYRRYERLNLQETWFAEMMNMPVMGSHGIILSKDIQYRPLPAKEDLEYGYITVDLAISEKETAHETTISVHGAYDGIRHLVSCDGYKGLDPVELFFKIVEACRRWNIGCVGIEDVAYQASLQFFFPHFCRLYNIEGIKFFPLSAKGRKVERIITWASLIKAGEYVLTEGEIYTTMQLLCYDKRKGKGNVDDRIDGASYGPQMEERYLTDIIESRQQGGSHTGTVLTTYQVSAV